MMTTMTSNNNNSNKNGNSNGNSRLDNGGATSPVHKKHKQDSVFAMQHVTLQHHDVRDWRSPGTLSEGGSEALVKQLQTPPRTTTSSETDEDASFLSVVWHDLQWALYHLHNTTTSASDSTTNTTSTSTSTTTTPPPSFFTPQQAEEIAILVHSILTNETTRSYHGIAHVLKICAGASPLQFLAALFRDVIVHHHDDNDDDNDDKNVDSNDAAAAAVAKRKKREDPAVERQRTLLQGIVEPSSPSSSSSSSSSTLRLASAFADPRDAVIVELFGYHAGMDVALATTTSKVFGGWNIFLSTIWAARLLGPTALPLPYVAQLAVCLEATIPFRPASTQPLQRLYQRLQHVNTHYQLGLSETEMIRTMQQAADLHNRILGNLVSHDLAEVVHHTWRLLPEQHVALRQHALYTLCDYYTALYAMYQQLQSSVLLSSSSKSKSKSSSDSKSAANDDNDNNNNTTAKPTEETITNPADAAAGGVAASPCTKSTASSSSTSTSSSSLFLQFEQLPTDQELHRFAHQLQHNSTAAQAYVQARLLAVAVVMAIASQTGGTKVPKVFFFGDLPSASTTSRTTTLGETLLLLLQQKQQQLEDQQPPPPPPAPENGHHEVLDHPHNNGKQPHSSPPHDAATAANGGGNNHASPKREYEDHDDHHDDHHQHTSHDDHHDHYHDDHHDHDDTTISSSLFYDPAVYELLCGVRLAETAFDTPYAPLAAYLYRTLGTAGVARAVASVPPPPKADAADPDAPTPTAADWLTWLVTNHHHHPDTEASSGLPSSSSSWSVVVHAVAKEIGRVAVSRSRRVERFLQQQFPHNNPSNNHNMATTNTITTAVA